MKNNMSRGFNKLLYRLSTRKDKTFQFLVYKRMHEKGVTLQTLSKMLGSMSYSKLSRMMRGENAALLNDAIRIYELLEMWELDKDNQYEQLKGFVSKKYGDEALNEFFNSQNGRRSKKTRDRQVSS